MGGGKRGNVSEENSKCSTWRKLVLTDRCLGGRIVLARKQASQTIKNGTALENHWSGLREVFIIWRVVVDVGVSSPYWALSRTHMSCCNVFYLIFEEPISSINQTAIGENGCSSSAISNVPISPIIPLQCVT